MIVENKGHFDIFGGRYVPETLMLALEELEAKSGEDRNLILTQRQKIIRTLVNKVTVDSQRNIHVYGVLDGTEGEQFELRGY